MKYRNDLSTGAYVKLQEARMRAFTGRLQGNQTEAEQLQKDLNLQMALITNPGQATEESSIIDQFLKDLGDAMAIEITNTLNMTEASKDSKSGAVRGEDARRILESISKRDKKFNAIANPGEARTVRRSDVESMIRKLEGVQKNKLGDPAAIKKLREIELELKKLNAAVTEAGAWHKIGRGFNLELDKSTDIGKTAYRINKLLNYANELIIVGDVSSEIGIIGEQAIAAMLTIVQAEKERLTKEGIQALVQGFLGGGNLKSGAVTLPSGIRVAITGDDKSRKGYYADEVSAFTPHAKQSGKFVSFGSTDDKVDIEIEVPSEERTITASIKNYSNPSEVTILKGNIFPMLANYSAFMKHYMKLISSSDAPQGDLNQMYQAIKFTVGIHALVGGVKAIKNDSIITTPTASYFIVNNNKSRNKGVEVIPTNLIASQILENADLIDLMGDDKIASHLPKADRAKGNILAYYDKSADLDKRFSNISVNLKLNQIKRSITT